MTRKADVDYGIEDIDPCRAEELLLKNTHNRNLRERVVNSYAADMTAGAWRENGESIKIAVDGTVVDGQHRLHAVIKSGTKHRMLVVRGLPMDTQDTVDGGAKRKFGDVLALRGEERSCILASVVRRIHLWERGIRGRGAGTYSPTVAQMLATLEENPNIRQSARVADSVRTHVPIPASILGVCHWLFSNIDDEDCGYFFDRLRDGANLPPTDPIYTLRRTVIEAAGSGTRRLNEQTLTAFVIKAWNTYRKGDTMTRLVFRAGGANPEAFPEPE